MSENLSYMHFNGKQVQKELLDLTQLWIVRVTKSRVNLKFETHNISHDMHSNRKDM